MRPGKPSRFCLLLCLILCTFSATAETIDIGIFESEEPGKVEVRIRPDFTILGNQTITAIRYTIRWADPALEISTQYIAPYFLHPLEEPYYFEGHFYQVFLAVPQDSIGTILEAGHERLVSTFTYSGADCVYFELAQDEWTSDNNGNPLLELQGVNKTGVIYQPQAHMGSVGGLVKGSKSIELGENTGTLLLEDHSGTVLGWERKHNDQEWQAIEGSQEQSHYSETPYVQGKWQYRAVVQRNDCEPAHSQAAKVYVIAHTSWTGLAGTDWFNEGNWSEMVPDYHVSAMIPGNTEWQPEIHDNFGLCHQLLISEGASLSIGHNAGLSVTDSLINQGIITIEASASGSGSLIHHNQGVEATIQLYLEGSNDWPGFHENSYLLAAPVEGQDITGFLGQDEHNEYALYAWLEEDSDWISHQDENWEEVNDGMLFNTGQGYLGATQDTQTPSFQGSIPVTSIPMENLARSTGQMNESQAGWHLLGNPFPSSLTWDQNQWQLQNVCGSAQVWDRQAQSYRVIGDGMEIGPLQGFFVQADQGSSGSLVIPHYARIHPGQDQENETGTEQIVLKARDMENGSFQRTIIAFHPDATNDYDSHFDARFLPGHAARFYVNLETEKLAAFTLAYTNDIMNIPLGFVKNQSDNFRIEAARMPQDLELLLHDNKKDSTHKLTAEMPYYFTSLPTDDPGRFVLKIQDGEAANSAGQAPGSEAAIRAWVFQNQLFIVNREYPVNVHVFNAAGQILRTIHLQEGSHVSELDMPAGVYVIQFYNKHRRINSLKAILPGHQQ